MRKLLSANFSRLWKNKIFWMGTLFMFGLGVIAACSKYSYIIRYKEKEYLDDALFAFVIFTGCCSAVFCSMFSGTEYSDGTIRNKLAVGHLRSSIYLSSWLVSIVAAVIMAIAFLFSYGTLGSILLEPPRASVGKIVSCLWISLFTIISFTSLFHLLSMLIARKSVSAVVCLLVFWGLLIVAMIIRERLAAPEFMSNYILTVNGVEQTEPQPNPRYLQPAARMVHQFFMDLLPSGQSMQLFAQEIPHPFLLIVYSAAISVITAVLGVFAFGKKDLK